jgi:hypothetical protein
MILNYFTKQTRVMKRIINYFKREWEIFCFVDSCESITNSKDYTTKKITEIKLKYKQD